MAMQLDGSALVTVSIGPNWVLPAETADSRMLPVIFLRDRPGTTGKHFGRDMIQCGECTVPLLARSHVHGGALQGVARARPAKAHDDSVDSSTNPIGQGHRDRSAGPVQNGLPAFVCRELFAESRRAVPKRRIPPPSAG